MLCNAAGRRALLRHTSGFYWSRGSVRNATEQRNNPVVRERFPEHEGRDEGTSEVTVSDALREGRCQGVDPHYYALKRDLRSLLCWGSECAKRSSGVPQWVDGFTTIFEFLALGPGPIAGKLTGIPSV